MVPSSVATTVSPKSAYRSTPPLYQRSSPTWRGARKCRCAVGSEDGPPPYPRPSSPMNATARPYELRVRTGQNRPLIGSAKRAGAFDRGRASGAFQAGGPAGGRSGVRGGLLGALLLSRPRLLLLLLAQQLSVLGPRWAESLQGPPRPHHRHRIVCRPAGALLSLLGPFLGDGARGHPLLLVRIDGMVDLRVRLGEMDADARRLLAAVVPEVVELRRIFGAPCAALAQLRRPVPRAVRLDELSGLGLTAAAAALGHRVDGRPGVVLESHAGDGGEALERAGVGEPEHAELVLPAVLVPELAVLLGHLVQPVAAVTAGSAVAGQQDFVEVDLETCAHVPQLLGDALDELPQVARAPQGPRRLVVVRSRRGHREGPRFPTIDERLRQPAEVTPEPQPLQVVLQLRVVAVHLGKLSRRDPVQEDEQRHLPGERRSRVRPEPRVLLALVVVLELVALVEDVERAAGGSAFLVGQVLLVLLLVLGFVLLLRLRVLVGGRLGLLPLCQLRQHGRVDQGVLHRPPGCLDQRLQMPPRRRWIAPAPDQLRPLAGPPRRTRRLARGDPHRDGAPVSLEHLVPVILVRHRLPAPRQPVALRRADSVEELDRIVALVERLLALLERLAGLLLVLGGRLLLALPVDGDPHVAAGIAFVPRRLAAFPPAVAGHAHLLLDPAPVGVLPVIQEDVAGIDDEKLAVGDSMDDHEVPGHADHQRAARERLLHPGEAVLAEGNLAGVLGHPQRLFGGLAQRRVMNAPLLRLALVGRFHLASQIGPERFAHPQRIAVGGDLRARRRGKGELARRGRVVLGDPAEHRGHRTRMAARVLPGARVDVVEGIAVPAAVPLRQHAHRRRADDLACRRRPFLRRWGPAPRRVAPALDLALGDELLASALAARELERVAAVAQVPGALRVLVVPGVERGAQLQRELVPVLVHEAGEQRVVPSPPHWRPVAEVLQVLDSDQVHLALAALPLAAAVADDLLQRLVPLGRVGGQERGGELRPRGGRVAGVLRLRGRHSQVVQVGPAGEVVGHVVDADHLHGAVVLASLGQGTDEPPAAQRDHRVLRAGAVVVTRAEPGQVPGDDPRRRVLRVPTRR